MSCEEYDTPIDIPTCDNCGRTAVIYTINANLCIECADHAGVFDHDDKKEKTCNDKR